MANSRNLEFGLWYSFRNPEQWRTDYHGLYQDHLNQIIQCESLGYDDVWLTEHHFCEDGHSPSIIPLASAIAVLTKKIRIGTGVLLLPLHNAIRIAEDTATIDILSNGRFELGVGIGYRPQEFETLSVNLSDRAALINEGIEIIKKLWAGGFVSFEGNHYSLKDVFLEPKPLQRPGPPLWVGGFAAAAAKRAARLGDGYIGTGEMTEQAKIFRDEWHRLERTGEPQLAGGHFWLVASKTPDKTFAEIAPHVLYQIETYNKWLGEAGQTLFPAVKTADELKQLGILNCVSPQHACDLIGDYVESTGIQRYYTWTVPPGYPVTKMTEHLSLFAQEVMPQFKR
jgi:alkanesulfonate monooxygenase SsuD/methylene tetrahydromethanopterin reductase-like flavin-dependent oxidoreductase (luciferase family)